MNTEKKKHLGTNLIVISIIFAVCICIGMGCIGMVIYYKSMMSRCEKYITGILNIASVNLDGDDLEQCIDTQTESEKYKESQKLLNQIRDCYDIKYVYVVKPLKETGADNMMYVMTGISKEELNDTDNAYLGKLSGTEYGEAVTGYYISAMSEKDITYYANKTSFGYMYSGLKAVRNSDGEAVAVLAVDVSIKEMVEVLTKYIQSIAAAGILIALIFFAGLYRWIRRRVVVPIQKLDAAANDFVKKSHEGLQPSELEFKDPEIRSGDEIQTLADSLITLSDDLKSYMNTLLSETKEKERIASELSIATHIQASMLPCIFPPFPNVSEFDIYASMSPAKEVGGDFYDFFMIDENHLAVVMADVSGKGVPAALFMVIGKTLIKDYSGFGGSLGEVFTKVNDLLCESNKEELFITAFEGVLDLRTGELEFVNAGHEKPIVYHKDEDIWEVYPTRAGFVLAGLEGIQYRSGTMNLKKGDRLFLYTDGIPEAVNPLNEQYGMDRLVQVLQRNKNTELNRMITDIRTDVDEFADGAEQFDDITMLCMEFNEYK